MLGAEQVERARRDHGQPAQHAVKRSARVERFDQLFADTGEGEVGPFDVGDLVEQVVTHHPQREARLLAGAEVTEVGTILRCDGIDLGLAPLFGLLGLLPLFLALLLGELRRTGQPVGQAGAEIDLLPPAVGTFAGSQHTAPAFRGCALDGPLGIFGCQRLRAGNPLHVTLEAALGPLQCLFHVLGTSGEGDPLLIEHIRP